MMRWMVCNLGWMFVAAGFIGAADDARAADAALQQRGVTIYKKHCASCHGDKGQGVELEYDEPLVGKRTLSGLISYIDRKMPEGNKKAVVGDDAKAVAHYIYDAFYSPVAQARNAPPRVRLSRLTVHQYRHAVADLIGSFGEPVDMGDKRGLQARYFHSGRFDFDDRPRFQRVEVNIEIDFGGNKPHKSLDGKRFGILYAGSIFVEETGDYEFILESPNGIKLWMNDIENPIIDARVRSGNFDPIRARVFLLGGRWYPIRAALFKYEKDKRSGITMRWRRPHRVDEVVPSKVLSPVEVKQVMVVQTAFPPDDRSMGYVHGSAVSKQWDEATTYGALETAEYVATRLSALSKQRNDQQKQAFYRQIAHQFVERAWGRPLNDAQKQVHVERQFKEAKDLEQAIKRVVLLALKSPRFLYPQLNTGDKGQPDDFTVASRLALLMWDSIPDKVLLDAAKRGELHTQEQIRQAVQRMMNDPRAHHKAMRYFQDWLHVDRLHNLSKNREMFPDFNDAIVADLRDSLDLFIDDVMWSEASSFQQLLNSNEVYLNARLAAFYDAKVSKQDMFEKVKFEKQHHAGVLSHPLLMAGFAYDSTSSPIHRGVFVAKSLLGRRLRPPPNAVTPVAVDVHPDLTTRERVTLHTKADACMSCHSMINPLGFTLENYDAVGRFRLKEGGKPVDATGFYRSLEGQAVKFQGAAELGKFLADSEEAQAAFVQRMFLFTVKQPMLAYGLDTPQRLHGAFKASKFNMQHLLSEIVITAAMDGLEEEKSGKNEKGS